MDYRLLQRRNGKRERGRECWLVQIFAVGSSTPDIALTTNFEDITYDSISHTSDYSVEVEQPPDAGSDGLPTGRLAISNVSLGLQQSLTDHDFFREGRCVIIPYNTEEPDVSYADATKELEIVSHETTLKTVKFTLAVPKELIEMVPEDIYNPFGCRHRFAYARCGYTKVAIVGITLSGTSPVAVQATAHRLTTSVRAELASVVGITPSLNDDYIVTRVDDNNFTLDGTDSSDYSGAFVSGLAGFFNCGQSRDECSARGRLSSFEGFPGLRPDTILIGA